MDTNTTLHSSYPDDWPIRRYVVNTVLTVIGAIVGITGNVFVLSMYSCKMKKRRDDRYFIPCLAFINLLAIIVSVVFFITLNTLNEHFSSDVTCKTLNFANRVTFLTSLLILLVIAIQRYKKICHAFGNRISLVWKRFSICVSLIASCVVSIPMLVFYGVREIKDLQRNITKYRCQLLPQDSIHAQNSLYSFHATVFLLIFLIVTGITVLYLIIGRRIHSNVHVTRKTISTSNTSLYSNSVNQIDRSNKNESSIVRIRSKTETDLSFPTLVMYSGNGVNIRRTQSDMRSNSTNLKGVKRLNVNRYTYMFFTMSVVTFISYIPPFILIVLETMYADLWTSVTGVQLNILLIFRRMYLLSYVINPFLFGFFDRSFRKELKTTLLLRCINNFSNTQNI